MAGGYTGGYNANFKIVCNMDAPPILNASVTPIPGSGTDPLQVVASLPEGVNKYHVIDGVGEFLGLYAGAPGQEVLQFIMGGGTNTGALFHALPKGTRVSIRNMSPETITKGALAIQFARQ